MTTDNENKEVKDDKDSQIDWVKEAIAELQRQFHFLDGDKK